MIILNNLKYYIPIAHGGIMFYLVYKTINLINQKYYIGAHTTLDKNDNYFGSGKTLKKALKK